jgi:periplasmic divalent cation tolerance protein
VDKSQYRIGGREIDNLIVVMVSCVSEEEAQKIAGLLVEAHLAACVNIMPVQSIYEWQGKLEDQKEWLMFIKSEKSLFNDIKTMVSANHSYEIPEIVALDISMASENYGDWIKEFCRIKN